MKNYSAFDVIGPRMIGPSSSHTAGAARLGKVAKKISGKDIKEVVFILYGSFAKTYRGHGTDRALVAGILGMDPNDEKLSKSMEIAEKEGLVYTFVQSDEDVDHPNTVRIIMTNEEGKKSEILGSSIGGGNILVTEINGLALEFTGEYPTLIIHHFDKPGVVADVTHIMDEFEINIAFMKVFRQRKGEDAFMIIETDHAIPQKVLEEIRELRDEIMDVYLIEGL
ncbi:L-serine ammonia-lyase, iron-sulfur-dependent subunit beta [Thermotalea metallivorans]|uniref:L-serine deaminase n=1 Tax=Thermotalea metallivorans TaxID=520762 RepID=A0A140L2X4_9FIRM|nr:L-serine ammonia-lyase, iron-sulfur-dependent subunit beta [Thermotalea metallivorans]KXG74899.1 L-serine dehydratase, beta chain [Thermotalea metallivorans]